MVAVKTILLVEDDQVAATMYQSRLEREGYHVQIAPDGPTALMSLLKLTVDLVILDLMLPKLDGAEVLKAMRMHPPLRNVPVVVFSNAPTPELSEELLLKGLTRRLHKTDTPFPVLVQTIQELLAAAALETPATEPADGEAAPRPAEEGEGLPGDEFIALPGRLPPRGDFLKDASKSIAEIREHCCAFIRAPGSPDSAPHLAGLLERAEWIRANAKEADCGRVAMLTQALHALLSEIKARPTAVTPSILQTIAQAVDCLGLLSKSNAQDLAKPMDRAKVLAVDDDSVCGMVAVNVLKRANFDAESISDPVAALQWLRNTRVDVVLLDISMPGMTGFELCEKIRRLPHCKTTPIIFVTAHSNFDNRKQSVLSGGQDFITKPIFPLELALKVTLHLLKTQVLHQGVPGLTSKPDEADPSRTAGAEVAPRDPPALSAGNRIAPTDSTTNQSSSAGRIATQDEAPVLPAAAAVAEQRSTASPVAELPISSNQETASAASQALQISSEHRGAPDDRSDLQARLAAEQAVTAKLRQDLLALQEKQRESDVALEKARSELREQTAKSEAAADASAQAEKTLHQLQARCQELECEAANLRTERDELQARLAAVDKAAADARRHYEALRKEADEKAALLDQATADAKRRCEELNAANTALEKGQAALRNQENRCTQLRDELDGLQAEHSRLQKDLETERNSASASREQSESLQRQLRQDTNALAQTRAELEQQKVRLDAADAATRQAQQALQEYEGRCGRLEKAAADLEAARSELERKLLAEEENSAQYRQTSEEKETTLRDNAAALEKVEAELRQQAAKLEATEAAARQAEQTLRQTQARCQELEQQAEALRAGRDELRVRLEAGQNAEAGVRNECEALRRQIESLQRQLQDGTTALTQTRGELDQQKIRLDAATAATQEAQRALQEKEDRAGQLQTAIADLEAIRSDLHLKLSAEKEASTGYRLRIEALETTLQANAEALVNARAELAEQTAKWQASATAVERADHALRVSQSRCQDLEGEIAALRTGRDELQSMIEAERKASAVSREDRANLQRRLRDSTAALEHLRDQLRQQEAERERQEAAARDLAAAHESSNAELTRLREQLESMKQYPALDPAPGAAGQRFQLTAPDAGNVLLVGDFTGWQKEPIQMKPGLDGVWHAAVDLQPGTYHYMFIVDGRWTEDPACTQREANEFGGHNMVRKVS
jgi:DNA-binding response OmpR family regulator/chromosome segregation ATPase